MITIKTEKEIALLREGGSRHAGILLSLTSLVRPGLSTTALNDLAARLIQDGGDKASFLNYTPKGASRPFPASICISVNNEVVHGIPHEKPRILKEGDIVSLDLGVTHKGMITDAAVTVAVGKISPTAQNLIDITAKALVAGIAAARGGNRVGDIGHAVFEVVGKSPFSVVEELTGHGVGYSVHEDPYVPNIGKKGQGAKLRPGMVIAIEPIVNEGSPEIIFDEEDGYTLRTADGKKSAHFEHTLLITAGAPEVLTASHL